MRTVPDSLWIALLLAAVAGCTGCEDPRSPVTCRVRVTLVGPFDPAHPSVKVGSTAQLNDLVYEPVLPSWRLPHGSARVLATSRDTVELEVLPARFHDDSPVLAEDVAGSIRAFSDGSLSARATSSQRLLVTSPSGTGFDQLESLPVTRADMVDSPPSWTPPPGTGPFRLKHMSAERAQLERWQAWPGAAPGITDVTINTVESVRTSWAFAMRGETDFLLEVPRNLEGFLGQLSEWHLKASPAPVTYFLVASPRARRTGLERLAVVLASRTRPAAGGTPCRMTPDVPVCSLTPGDEPTFAAPESPVELIYWVSDDTSAEGALRLQQRSDHLGIQATVVPLSIDELVTRLADGAYDLALLFTPGYSRFELANVLKDVLARGEDAALKSPGIAGDALQSMDALRAAWRKELPIAPWFTQQPRVAVRSPFDRFPIAATALRSIASWSLPEGCSE